MGPISGLGKDIDEALQGIISHRVRNENRIDEELLTLRKRIDSIEKFLYERFLYEITKHSV